MGVDYLEDHLIELEQSRQKLLGALADAKDLTLLFFGGNTGDRLIWHGTGQLLRGLKYRVITSQIQKVTGDTALIVGSGGWCKSYHLVPTLVPTIEKHFRKTIILSSSFDISAPIVKETLMHIKATVFAREKYSYDQIRDLCNAELAHDCAFFFDFEPYKRPGTGVLLALRTDKEAVYGPVPPNNQDISLKYRDLKEWLGIIAAHDLIVTDRAHVMIAGAMLGKQVYYRPNSYHKLQGIAEYALRSFPVKSLEPDNLPVELAGYQVF